MSPVHEATEPLDPKALGHGQGRLQGIQRGRAMVMPLEPRILPAPDSVGAFPSQLVGKAKGFCVEWAQSYEWLLRVQYLWGDRRSPNRAVTSVS